MWLLALRDLQWRRRRFLIAVLATSLVFALTLLLSGAGTGVRNEAGAIVELFDADAWFVAEGTSGPFTASSTLPVAKADEALVTTLGRRRRELAVLRTLGFLRRQLRTSVVAFATTTVVLAIAVVPPLGIGIGRWAWRLVAESLGTPAGPVVPADVVALILPVTLLVALAVAALPARAAASTDPATVLRGE
ncbi:hypothetical protein BH18ACT1_BH18ACT1_13550 [soil metagenome]